MSEIIFFHIIPGANSMFYWSLPNFYDAQGCGGKTHVSFA